MEPIEKQDMTFTPDLDTTPESEKKFYKKWIKKINKKKKNKYKMR